MNKVFIFFLMGAFSPCFGALPPLESLFRNASNPTIKATTVTVKLRIRQVSTGSPDLFYQLVFSRRGNLEEKRSHQDFDVFQIQHDDLSMKDQSIRSVSEKRRLFQYFKRKKDSLPIRDVFWASLSTLFLNDSSIMSSFLEKNDSRYSSNEKLTNKERIALYSNYKEYLKKIKKDSKLKDSLTSPLSLRKRKNDEAKKIKETIKSPFYLASKGASLIRKGQNFYILLELEKTTALFSNQDLKLLEFSYLHLDQPLDLKFFRYRPFNRIGHQAPGDILLSFQDKKYHINVISTKHEVLSEKRLRKQKQKIRKAQKENKNKITAALPSPPFLF